MTKLLKKLNWKIALQLMAVFLLAIALRSFRLTEAPIGALIDEAHFGFLAKSIAETGRDEHGVFLPLNFRGFGDDKLPLQTYLLVPIISTFGLNTATIRYPSIFFGSLLTIVVYFLLRQLRFSHPWRMAGALITAIAPWTFILSRFGFESNLALFFFTAGLIPVLSWLDKPTRTAAIAAGILWGLTWYSYIAYRPITIVFLLGIVAWQVWQQRGQAWKSIWPMLLTFILVVLPLFQPGVVANNSTRINQVGLTSDAGIALEVNENRNYCSSRINSSLICYAASNKYTIALRELMSRFFETYSPQFLGTSGEATETFLTVENFGQFYSILYPFFILGLMGLAFTVQADKNYQHLWAQRWFILFGLLITPIPSIFAGHPQKVRISALFPFVLIAIVWGLRLGYRLIKNWNPAGKLAMLGLAGFVALQAYIFFVSWFGVHVVKNGYQYQSYLPQVMEFVEQQAQSEDTRIVFKPFFSDPLMFYAFYTDMDPREYQQLAVLGEREASGFQHTVGLGNLSVSTESLGGVGCQAIANDQRVLFVTDENIESGTKILTVWGENGVDPRAFVYDAGASVKAENCVL